MTSLLRSKAAIDLTSPAEDVPLRAPDDAAQMSMPRFSMSKARLRKHADYQRVYKSSGKHSSASMSYFFSVRAQEEGWSGPRVGLTAGRVMGKAVDRNRIKRRMREAVRLHVSGLPQNVDVILHPRRSVLTADFAKLNAEVGRIFTSIRKSLEAGPSSTTRQSLMKPSAINRRPSISRAALPTKAP